MVDCRYSGRAFRSISLWNWSPIFVSAAQEKKTETTQRWVWFHELFSCSFGLILLFAVFRVVFLGGSISQRLVGAPCIVSNEPFP